MTDWQKFNNQKQTIVATVFITEKKLFYKYCSVFIIFYVIGIKVCSA